MHETAVSKEKRPCYVFRYLRKREAFYPMVIQRDLENGFS
jgi:hypothetical protein